MNNIRQPALCHTANDFTECCIPLGKAFQYDVLTVLRSQCRIQELLGGEIPLFHSHPPLFPSLLPSLQAVLSIAEGLSTAAAASGVGGGHDN